MIGAAHLIVVAPHPDDETIALGGTIHDHLRRGGSCQIVAVTEGEAADNQASPEERAALALRRAAERAAALETVGAGAAGVDRLRYPDREVHAHLRTLERELAELFADALRGRESCLVVLPWREDPHDDHRACASAGVPAAIHAGVPYVEMPIWGWYDDQARRRLPSGRTWRLRISDAAGDRKRAALRCFRSQFELLPGSRGPVLPEGFFNAFDTGYEVLLR